MRDEKRRGEHDARREDHQYRISCTHLDFPLPNPAIQSSEAIAGFNPEFDATAILACMRRARCGFATVGMQWIGRYGRGSFQCTIGRPATGLRKQGIFVPRSEPM